jgi:hypothetical protein
MEIKNFHFSTSSRTVLVPPKDSYAMGSEGYLPRMYQYRLQIKWDSKKIPRSKAAKA